MTVVTSNINWGRENWRTVLESDAKGYYAYLPAIFIYHDLNFGFFDEIEKRQYYDENLFYDYRAFTNGHHISKYYIGTALIQMPAFLAAHAMAGLSGADTDGYSKPYMIAVTVSALLSLIMGLFFMDKSFRHFGFSASSRITGLIVTVFGTNLFYYVVSEPGMSHVYSFGVISAFIWVSVCYFDDLKPGRIPVMAFLLALIILIRPVNGLILFFLPFLSGGYDHFIRGLKALAGSKLSLIISILIFAAILSIQLIFYRLATGRFLIYSYIGEGFDFTNPHFYQILFSFKKGLFIYTPVYLLAFTGGFYFLKHDRFRFFAWIMFFILITWVFSSWSNWWYGGSFSSRVYIEYLPAFMLVFLFAFGQLKSRVMKRGITLLLMMLIVLCQIQTYQYRYNQIHWSDMDRDKYFEVFLRVDRLL